MYMKLSRKFVISVVINLPQKILHQILVTRPEMTYNGYKFFAQNGEHLATIYQSCFFIMC